MNNEEIQEILDESEQTEFFVEEDMLVGPAGPQGEPGKSGNDVKVYPTSPTTGETVWIQKSKNRFNKDGKIIEGYYIDNSGSMIASTGAWYQEEYIPIESNTAFTISSEVAILRAIFYDKDYNFISRASTSEKTLSFTTPENCAYLRVSGNTSSSQLASLQLEPGLEKSTYEPFKVPQLYLKKSDGTYEELTGSLDVDYYQPKTNQNVWFKNNINILDTKQIITTEFNGVTITSNADGTLTFNGTCTQAGNLVLLKDLNKVVNGKYTLYLKVLNNGTLTNSNCRISINDSTNSSAGVETSRIISLVWNPNITEISTAAVINNKEMHYLSIYINKDCTYTNCKIRLQLEQGAKKEKAVNNQEYYEETSNEIYFKNTSGNYEKFSDTIEVNSTKPLNNNKIWLKETNNLFNYKRAEYLNLYVDGTTLMLRQSTTEKHYTTFVRCKPNTAYTLSKKAGKSFRIATATQKPAIGIYANQTQANHSATKQTITTGPNDNYLVFTCFSDYDEQTITYSDMYATVQVEEGMVATNYSKNTDNGFYTKNKSGNYNKFSESVSVDSLEPINNSGVWLRKTKNLFDFNTFISNYIENSTYPTNLEADYINKTITLTNWNNNSYFPRIWTDLEILSGLEYINLLPNSTYTLKFKSSNIEKLRTQVYYLDTTTNTYKLLKDTSKVEELTFTTNEFTKIVIRFGSADAIDTTLTFSNIYLGLGTDNHYEKNTSSQILVKNSQNEYEKFSDTVDINPEISSSTLWIKSNKNQFNLNDIGSVYSPNWSNNVGSTHKTSNEMITVNIPANKEHCGIFLRLGDYIPKVKGKIITVSADIKLDTGLANLQFAIEGVAVALVTNTDWKRISVTGKVSENSNALVMYAKNTSTDTAYNYYVKNIQIEYGEDLTPYTPNFGNKIMVKDAQNEYKKFSDTIEIDYSKPNGSVWVCTSKNKAKVISTTRTSNGITLTALSNSELKVKGTPTANVFLGIVASISLKAGRTYTISTSQAMDSQMFIYSNKAEKIGLTYSDLQIQSGKSKTFTAKKDGEIDIALYIYSGKGAVDYNLKLQVEENSIPTEYEPYVTDHIFVKKNNESYEELNLAQTNYSLQEQIIGTAHNGKILYKKTIINTLTSVNGLIIYTDPNLENVINMYGTVNYANGVHQIGAYFNSEYYSGLQYNSTEKAISFFGSNTYVNSTINFTIEYTKATDY